jgi:ribosome-associated protein
LATKRKAGGSDTGKKTKKKAAAATPKKKAVSAAPKKKAASSKGSRKAASAVPPEERARKLAMSIAEVALDNKALNVEIIDVRGKVDYSDYVVVMSGRSDRQVNALGRNIEDDLKEKHGARCLGVEGMPQGTWLLMDYGDVIVHVFHEDTRGYYDLETLWIDAARVAVDEGPGGAPARR